MWIRQVTFFLLSSRRFFVSSFPPETTKINKKSRLACHSLSQALQATSKRFSKEAELGIKPPSESGLSEEQLKKIFHIKLKEKVSKAFALATVIGGLAYGYFLWKTPVEKEKYVYDRYGRRFDPETGDYIPRKF